MIITNTVLDKLRSLPIDSRVWLLGLHSDSLVIILGMINASSLSSDITSETNLLIQSGLVPVGVTIVGLVNDPTNEVSTCDGMIITILNPFRFYIVQGHTPVETHCKVINNQQEVTQAMKDMASVQFESCEVVLAQIP